MWEYKMAGILFFGSIGLVIALIILCKIIEKVVDEIEYNRQAQRIAEAEKQGIREKWYMSRDEFEDAAKVALNMGSVCEFQVYMKKTDYKIQVLLKGDEKYHDKN
ncbi:MAG: hypothetical protein IJ731_06115 [Eubacterium sp.]|nr:hypothetical protein [Eubacterium sp.]